ncbi:hypothetical protein KSS87_008353 [Heliosperma pusillum]|nr:hypothetical protein KSS87_015707 [Heliosperma pusillum]KAH9623615.1 hypothetical protein KSS87_008353 [Heliosperma pusillum]
MELKTVRSQRWGYTRIIAGTIAGGMLGFYVMHRIETSYKAKWDEQLKKYVEEKARKENENIEVQSVDSSVLFSDDHSSPVQSN